MSKVILVASLILFTMIPPKLWAASTEVSLCNTSENPFRAAILEQSRYQGELVWGIRGWYDYPAQSCGYLGRVDDHWGGVAFSVGTGDNFQGFRFTPDREKNQFNESPGNVTDVCVTTDGGGFTGRRLSERELASVCPGTDSAVIPISVFLKPGFGDSRVRFNVSNAPFSKPDPEDPSGLPSQLNMSQWEGYIEACIPVLVNQYARIRKTAIFECTCYAAGLQLSFPEDSFTYEYPGTFNTSYESFPEEQNEKYAGFAITCNDRYLKTNVEFDQLVSKLVAARPPDLVVPVEELIVGEYSGITGHTNTYGPLKILAIDSSSRARQLKVGHLIHQVEWKPVRNLSELQEQIEAALAQGKTTIRLSMEGGGGYYDMELEF